MLEFGLILVAGGSIGAIGEILSRHTKKSKRKELEKELEIRNSERGIVEDSFRKELIQKDKEISNLKNQLNVVEIEEM